MMPPAATPRRILMTADAVGGVWQFALELAAGLCREGASILLAVTGPAPSAAQREAAVAIDGLALRHRAYRLEWMEEPEEDLRAADAWLMDLQAEFAPDIVHLNSYAFGPAAWAAPVVVTCHSCVLTWWRAVRGEDAPGEWADYAERVARGLLAADLVVAPTRSFLVALEGVYGRLPQTMVIANGRSGPYRPGRDKQPIVFSCGRAWDLAKGMDRLETLARRVAWPIHLAGQVRSPGGSGTAEAAGFVHALGHLDEALVAYWMAQAWIFVLPARYEPFGLAALEAAMSGCALVLGDIDTLHELWDGAALFAGPLDDAALFAATSQLIDDPSLCRAMGARAHARSRKYAAAVMVAGYANAYRRASLLRNLSGERMPVSTAKSGAAVAEARA